MACKPDVMTTSVYPIHQAIGRPILFKGFRAQYILVAGISLIADLLFFVILYLAGVPPWICIVIVFGLGAAALAATARLSKQFGQFGLLKLFARRRLPEGLRYTSRRLFVNFLK